MATQKVKTKVKTTTKKETARDQVCALAAGTHPRCGARSPLLHLAAPCHYGTDESAGVLALRLLWAWLVDNSRFYCMAFITSKPRKYLADAVMVTFEVSPTLLTLTHEGDVRWWVERQRENLVGANRDYLVVQQIEGGSLLCLQDRATGQRTALMVNNRDEYDWETNGTWVVLCEKAPIREMVVFEIPTKGVASSSSSSSLRGSWANAEPTVVPLDGGVLAGAGRVQLKCDCNFSSANDDHLLMWFYDRKGFFEILLIDLEQTCSSKKLAVLSSTVPRWDDLHLSYNVDLPRASFHVMTREGGVRQFAVHRGKKRPKADVYSVEEVSGRLQKIENIKGRIAEMDDCHLYSFHEDLSTYEVWDFNDTSKPLRKTQNHHATDCSDTPHAAGGLLFQVSDSRREIHVTDGFTGVTIVTFQLFRSFTMFTRLYSCR